MDETIYILLGMQGAPSPLTCPELVYAGSVEGPLAPRPKSALDLRQTVDDLG